MSNEKLGQIAKTILQIADECTDEEGSTMAAIAFKASVEEYFAVEWDTWLSEEES